MVQCLMGCEDYTQIKFILFMSYIFYSIFPHKGQLIRMQQEQSENKPTDSDIVSGIILTSQQLTTKKSNKSSVYLILLVAIFIYMAFLLEEAQYARIQHATPPYCLSSFLKRPCNRSHYGTRQMIMKTRYGFYMYGDSKQEQSVSYHICMYGTWQPHQISMMGRFVSPGDTILNIGTETSIESLVLAQIIGPTGKMNIFEPQNITYRLIANSYKKNNMIQNTRIYRIAASDRQTKLKLSTMGKGLLTGFSSNQTEPQVEAKTVDSVLPQDTVINFAIIGYRTQFAETLLGMKKVIQRSPNLVMLVFWDYLINQKRNEKKIRQILSYLIEKGYRFYSVHNFDPFTCKMGQFIERVNPLYYLLNIKFQDILLVPPRVTLPS